MAEWCDDSEWQDMMTVGLELGLIAWDPDADAYTLTDDGDRVREALAEARAHYLVTLT